MFGCNNDRLFPEKYTAKDHISNTKQEKGDHLFITSKHGTAQLLQELARETKQYLEILRQMKNFDEKAAREMRAKAYQERERKRLEVSLQTRGLLPNDFKNFTRITL